MANFENITIEKQDLIIPVSGEAITACFDGKLTAISCNALLKIVE